MLRQVVEQVNIILYQYEDEHFGDAQVHPPKGNVSFGSEKYCKMNSFGYSDTGFDSQETLSP